MIERWLAWGAEVPARTQLVLFRCVFFLLVALDRWETLVHAPRYGAGGFNVSHLPFLDPLLPVPRREVVTALLLVQLVLALRIAFGLARRAEAFVLAGLFLGLFAWSQLDSWQHHWLLALLLVLMAPVRWDRPEEAAVPVQVVRLQVAVVYGWAVLPKLHPSWLDGTLLLRQAGSPERRAQVEVLAGTLGVEPTAPWAWAAASVALLEAVLALALPSRRLRPWILVPGIAFHLGIEALGYRIGLFSWLMIALYVLVVPPSWFRRLDARLPGGAPARAPLPFAVAAGLALSAAVASLPLEGAVVSGVFAAGVALSGLSSTRRAAVAQLVVAGAVLLFHHQSDVARDYWKYLGGDARRRGEVALAVHAYEQVVRLDPDPPGYHLRLGDLHERADDLVRAREAWKQAHALAFGDDRLRASAARRLSRTREQETR